MYSAISESEARSHLADHTFLRFGSDVFTQFSNKYCQENIESIAIALNNARGIA